MAPDSKSTVVVGVDFGTTYSGFAWALRSEPDKVNKFYEWPHLKEAGGRIYCKTLTSLQYLTEATPGSYALQDWAYSALFKHCRHLRMARRSTPSPAKSHHLTRFKLHLARSSSRTLLPSVDVLPGLAAPTLIADYLRKLSEQVMKVLTENLGSHISIRDVQWCITVPAIWEEASKQQMITCAEMAGLVKGPNCKVPSSASPHPCMIVLEPEAASFYCQRLGQTAFPIESGDKFLVVDIGGGTVDLVLQEKVGPKSSFQVKEVSASSGDLCGGTYVDEAFLKFISKKIACFQDIVNQHPLSFLEVKGKWEDIKRRFDGKDDFECDLELPARLSRAWADHEQSECSTANSSQSYDEIELGLEDMRSIFDPVVDKILNLIALKIVPGLKAIMLVGGFSESPYLRKRIEERFESVVGRSRIVFPIDPGSAICCGAVGYGIHGPKIVSSRIAKRTYGMEFSEKFVHGKHSTKRMTKVENGELYCGNLFDIFIRKGDEVPLNHTVSKPYFSASSGFTQMVLKIYSTLDPDPVYTTDPGVRQEGCVKIPHPAATTLGASAKVMVSMYFGRTRIEVKIEGKNFGDQQNFVMVPITYK